MVRKKKGATDNFYGQPINEGALHRRMGIAQGKKIPRGRISSEIKRLEKIKNKTPAQLKKEKQDVFAKNFGGKRKKK